MARAVDTQCGLIGISDFQGKMVRLAFTKSPIPFYPEDSWESFTHGWLEAGKGLSSESAEQPGCQYGLCIARQGLYQIGAEAYRLPRARRVLELSLLPDGLVVESVWTNRPYDCVGKG